MCSYLTAVSLLEVYLRLLVITVARGLSAKFKMISADQSWQLMIVEFTGQHCSNLFDAPGHLRLLGLIRMFSKPRNLAQSTSGLVRYNS
jgi:hypothetical protein